MHILGLQEKKLSKGIERLPKNKREEGSLIELIYSAFDSIEYQFTNDEVKFDYAINLAVTWVNRLLFLKLLEGQLINFNESNTKYEFVNSRVIYDFNKLNELFLEF